MRTQDSHSSLRSLLIGTVLVIPAAAFFYWFFTCPCDRTPGGYLLGDAATERVQDWSFANTVPLCQIQIDVGLLPHSINLNCMSTREGDLYLSCSQCGSKRWSNAALENESARLRLEGTVYPVNVTRVTDPNELNRAWDARVTKLRTISEPASPPPPAGTPRPEHWWSFRVESR